LNATTDIYSRQQNAFNYFLLSAVAVIALAVCHAPEIFAATCARSFLDATSLLRGFSRHSMASRRLWKSIRGLLPRLKSLGLSGEVRQNEAHIHDPQSTVSAQAQTYAVINQEEDFAQSGGVANRTYDVGGTSGVPYMADFSSDLMDIFYALDDEQQFAANFSSDNFENMDDGFMSSEGAGISRRFLQGLI
jgi:hypothetical protein